MVPLDVISAETGSTKRRLCKFLLDLEGDPRDKGNLGFQRT
jgi:hypothetical protein